VWLAAPGATGSQHVTLLRVVSLDGPHRSSSQPAYLVGLAGFETCDIVTPSRTGAEFRCLAMPLEATRPAKTVSAVPHRLP
jgi:hypothetical protein